MPPVGTLFGRKSIISRSSITHTSSAPLLLPHQVTPTPCGLSADSVPFTSTKIGNPGGGGGGGGGGGTSILRRTMNLFKKKLSAKDALKESKREMSVATRAIEREIASLQMEEKKLVAEIKRTAKTGNEAATRILARQLVRLRQQITNLQGSRAQIRGVATHTQAMYANTSISVGMKGASKAMKAMNKEVSPAKQVKVMTEFQKQSAQMDMTLEMMSESIDETLDKDEAEEETEELTNQVLDEIGVDIASQLSSAPKGRIATKKVEQVAPKTESSDVDDLEKRLASLRRI